MDKTMLFDLEHIVAVDGNGGMIATFVLVDEDEDEMPPLVAKRCPNCHCKIEDLVEHRCSR
jgi:hypothetical protein